MLTPTDIGVLLIATLSCLPLPPAGAYIVGASLSAIVTGNAVHCVTNAFNLVFVFLGVWIAAAIVSGLAANYPMLVIGRLGAGVGQAAFGCVAFPYVDDEAPGVRELHGHPCSTRI